MKKSSQLFAYCFIWGPIFFGILSVLFLILVIPSLKRNDLSFNFLNLKNYLEIASFFNNDIHHDRFLNNKKYFKDLSSNIWNPFLGKKENGAFLKNIPKKRLRLSAILEFSNGRACIINGRFYKEFDVISGAKILSIERNSVQLLLPNKKKVSLYVGEEILY